MASKARAQANLLNADGTVKLALMTAVDSDRISDGAVTSAKIATGGVATVDMADGSVTSLKIANGGIDSADLATNSVSTIKIQDGAITSAKIANGTIDSADLASNSISTTKLQDGAVTAGKIADGAAVPSQTGNAGKFLTTDGSDASWATVITDLVGDSSPQLGGTLDANGNTIDMGTNSITDTKVGQWDTAYSWGDHALAGYADSASVQGQIDAINTELVSDTTPQLGGNLASNGNNINMGDGDVINVGDANDLQIYHSGSHSYINDQGTGDLYITGANQVRIGRNGTYENGLVFNENGAIQLYYDNAEKLATASTGVSVTGNLTASGEVTANSDVRLKSDIRTISNAIDIVKSLRGTSYIKDNKASLGLIAQEVEEVLPSVVATADDEMQTKSVAYGNLVGLLVEAIKEQQNQIDELKKRLEV